MRRIIAFGMAVFYFVRFANRRFCVFIKDVGIVHIIGEITDRYFHSNELEGNIVAYLIDRYRGVFADFSGRPVIEAFIQPFA